MNLFSSLSFGAPWILAALAALPVIWWLLRVTERALAALRRMRPGGTPQILWLSDGIDYGDGGDIERALAGIGRLSVFADAVGKGTLFLRSLDNETDGFLARIARTASAGTQEGDVAALGRQGETLATAHFRFAPDVLETSAKIPLPLEIRNETERVVIQDVDSTGAVQLLGSGSRRRAVEIVAARSTQDEQPLLSQTYYHERALAPIA